MTYGIAYILSYFNRKIKYYCDFFDGYLERKNYFMKTNKKTTFVRAIAMALSILMIASALVMLVPYVVSAADESEDYLSYPLSDYTPGTICYDPIPMLVIMVNFDADGDGVDDNPDGSGNSAVKNSKKPEYGEQWCHTTEEDWYNNLFDKENIATLNSYYQYMSGGKFEWIPAEETYGTENNGVIAATIKNVHPNCIAGSGQWVHCFNQILEEADKYVDFSKYDKNNNGIVEKYELCLALIIGGAETSSGTTTMKEVFGFHAYYKDYDQNNELTVDGVNVGRSGFFGTGAISGGKPLTFGVFAHELGHYLGAPDLYDTKNSGNSAGYDYAVRSYCMMANGSHGTSPSHFNPYILAEFGFYNTTQVHEDGVYTVYSKASTEGEYNIIKITTPNPDEYYLIENRYAPASATGNYDNSAASHQGILIWHIDESIHRKTGMSCNDEADGYDPTVIIYKPRKDVTAAPISVLEDASAFTKNPTYTDYAVFEPTGYTFPLSKTWYTSLTEEEAKLVENLRVEIISASGTEMQIKVTGVYDLKQTPEWTMNVYEKSQTMFKVDGRLDTLNYSVVSDATFVVTNKSTGTVVKSEQLKLKKDYTFSIVCDGLDPDTEYEYKIVTDTNFGEGVSAKTVYTNPVPVEKTQAKITLVVNSDLYKTPVTVKVKLGESLKVTFPLTKKGYEFGGWYLDEAYTQAYEIAPLESVDDFTLYAKWIEKEPEITTTKPTEPGTTAPDVQPGTDDPAPNNGSLIVIIAIVAVVVIGGAAVAVVIIKKKK